MIPIQLPIWTSDVSWYLAGQFVIRLLTVADISVVPTLGVVVLGVRHALEEFLRMLAKATPAHRHSPVGSSGSISAAIIPAHVGAGAGVKLISLE